MRKAPIISQEADPGFGFCQAKETTGPFRNPVLVNELVVAKNTCHFDPFYSVCFTNMIDSTMR